jgi:hypothetical protein
MRSSPRVRFIAAIVFFEFAATSAVAFTYIARTAASPAQTGSVTAGALTWTCTTTDCRIEGNWPAPGVSACAALAARVGKIVSYGRDGAMLNDAELGQCNSGLPAAKSTQLRVNPNLMRPIQPFPMATPLAPSKTKGNNLPPSKPADVRITTPAATTQVALEPGGRPEDLIEHVLVLSGVSYHGVGPDAPPPVLPNPVHPILGGRIDTEGLNLRASAPGAVPTPRSSSTPETPTYAHLPGSDVTLHIPVTLDDMPAETSGMIFDCSLFTTRFVPDTPSTSLRPEPSPLASMIGPRADYRVVAWGYGESFIRSINHYAVTYDIPFHLRPFFRLQDARSYACDIELRTQSADGLPGRGSLAHYVDPSSSFAAFHPAPGTHPILTVEGNIQ